MMNSSYLDAAEFHYVESQTRQYAFRFISNMVEEYDIEESVHAQIRIPLTYDPNKTDNPKFFLVYMSVHIVPIYSTSGHLWWKRLEVEYDAKYHIYGVTEISAEQVADMI